MLDAVKVTTPLNHQAEKARFFTDRNYNPQFTYAADPATFNLTVWGIPKQNYYDHAVRMLHKDDGQPVLKIPVTEEYVRQQVELFNTTTKLPTPIETHFSEEYLSRCRISKHHLYFKTPISYSQSTLADLLRHELETHLLRRLNHEQQPWANDVFPDESMRKTEEGLANIHTHLLREDKVTRKSYRTYIAIYLSQHHSFSEVFNQLKSFKMTDDLAWQLTVRGKRGLTDTSLPGGLTKDLVYFEGAVSIWQWLQNPSNDPRDLYLGRLGLEQIPHFKNLAKRDHLLYPTFFADLNQYRQLVATIGEVNEYNLLIK